MRAFGADAATAERFTLPYIRCAQANGVIATVKHFAGLGAVAVDTHLAPAILDSSRARLDTAELRPFRSAASIGVGVVMSRARRAPGDHRRLGPRQPQPEAAPGNRAR